MEIASASDLVSFVESAVVDGVLVPGDRLPSVRAQAATLDLSPNTVAAAYRRLRERGVVVGRGRQGTIVAPLAATTPSSSFALGDSVDALTGTPDPSLLPALGAFLGDLDYPGDMAYGHPMRLRALVTAGTAQFRSDGVDATHLTVTNGAMDAIERVLDAQRLTAGDRVAVEDPGHGPVHQLVRRRGLELVPLPIDDEGPTVPGVHSAVARGVGALIITPRAQNPTGAALSATRAAALATALATSPRTVLVIDDHAGPVAGTPYEHIEPPGTRWAVVRSLAKTYGPDLRVALVAGDADTIGAVDVGMQNGPGWVSHILQALAARLLTDRTIEADVRSTAESYTRRRRRLVELLARYGVEAHGRSGLNVWIPVDDEQGVVDSCRSRGYAIRAAARHRLVSPSAVRVTVSTLTDEQIDDVGTIVAAALRPGTDRAATV